jgi:hypothetical protein
VPFPSIFLKRLTKISQLLKLRLRWFRDRLNKSRRRTSRQIFRQTQGEKRKRWIQEMFWQKTYSKAQKIQKKIGNLTKKLKFKEGLLPEMEDGRRDHPRRCRTVEVECTILWRLFQETKPWSLARQIYFLLLQNHLIAPIINNIPCLFVSARCSFQSVSSNTPMPGSISPSPSNNWCSGSISSASSRTLCVRISTT